MKLVQYSFLIFVFLKQFYIFNSGTLQPGDFFLLISFLLCIVNKKTIFSLNKKDYSLTLFLFSVIIINLIYYYIYIDMEFILSTLYYIFNFIVVIVFRQLIEERVFLNRLVNILKVNLLCQFLFFLVGLGEYYAESRYMGTFNDPNQFAFYIYIVLMLIILVSHYENKKVGFIYYIITLILIFKSSSTGMLLAISSFIVLYSLLKALTKFRIKLCKPKIKIFKLLALMTLIMISLFHILNYKHEILKVIDEMPIFSRLEDKLDRIGKDEEKKSISLIEERGIDKLLLYPEKMIFGAGQGSYDRFNKAAHQLEVHSTFVSILFYYGILPIYVLMVWMYKNIRFLPIEMYAVIISLFIESLTLLNQRQPFFWMLFLLASLYEVNKTKVNDSKNISTKIMR